MTLRIGFGYEQQWPGIYIYDDQTGLVVVSDDVVDDDVIKSLTDVALNPEDRPKAKDNRDE